MVGQLVACRATELVLEGHLPFMEIFVDKLGAQTKTSSTVERLQVKRSYFKLGG